MKTILRQDSRDFPGHIYGQIADVPAAADYSFGVPKTVEDANGIDCTALSATKAGSSQTKEPYDEPDLWQSVPHTAQGADPRDTLGAMIKRGLKRLSDGLYDTRWVSYFRADLGPSDASTNIKRAMTAANSACTVATPWYRNWNSTAPGGVLPMGDSVVSNHDYIITGWDAEAFAIDAHLGYVLRMPFDVMNKVLSTWGSGAYMPSTVAINSIRDKTWTEALSDYFVNAILQIQALINQLKPPMNDYTTPPDANKVPPVVSIPPVNVNKPEYLWDTVENIKHSIHLIGDTFNLSMLQKDMLCDICSCESGFKLTAKLVNSPDSIDRGLFQINSKYHPEATDDKAYDPEWSARWACQQVKARINPWPASQKCWNRTGRYDSLVQ